MSDFPKPMLLHECDRDQDAMPILPTGDWALEPKLDGWRFMLHVRNADHVDWYGGRNGAEYKSGAFDNASRLLASVCPPDTILDCEVIVPGGSSGDVSSAIARNGTVEVWLFDVLRVNGHDVTDRPYRVRRHLLEQVRVDAKAVRLTPSLDNDERNFKAMLAAGFEGAVAKHRDGRYEVGKRSRKALKAKPQETLDATITGFVEGKGGRAGSVGAFRIRLCESGVETSVACYPYLAAQVSSDWLGRHIEFRHNGIQKSGSPRHPVFLRMRPERDAVAA